METLNNQTLDKESDLEHIARQSEWRVFSFPEKNKRLRLILFVLLCVCVCVQT